MNRLHGYVPALLVTHPTLAAAAGDKPAAQTEGSWSILQFAWDSGEAFGWQRIGTCLLIAIGLSLLLLLPFSRMIAGPKSVLARTSLFVGGLIALSAAFLALAGFVMRSESIALLVAVGVVYVAIVFAQTQHIFDASKGEAAGLLGCYLALLCGALFAFEYFNERMPWTGFLLKSNEERNRVFAEWQTGRKTPDSTAKSLTTPAPGPTTAPAVASSTAAGVVSSIGAKSPTAPPPPSNGELDLQAIYAQLQKARTELNMSDPVAVERFNVQAEAYNQEKALAAMRTARRSLPSKTEPADPDRSDKTAQAAPAAKTFRK